MPRGDCRRIAKRAPLTVWRRGRVVFGGLRVVQLLVFECGEAVLDFVSLRRVIAWIVPCTRFL